MLAGVLWGFTSRHPIEYLHVHVHEFILSMFPRVPFSKSAFIVANSTDSDETPHFCGVSSRFVLFLSFPFGNTGADA